MRNGFWLTLPPLLFSLSLLAIAPSAMISAEFNGGVPAALVTSGIIGQIVVFAMPAFFSAGLSTASQRRGLILYLVGAASYFITYGIQNLFPESDWSTRMIVCRTPQTEPSQTAASP